MTNERVFFTLVEDKSIAEQVAIIIPVKSTTTILISCTKNNHE